MGGLPGCHEEGGCVFEIEAEEEIEWCRCRRDPGSLAHLDSTCVRAAFETEVHIGGSGRNLRKHARHVNGENGLQQILNVCLVAIITRDTERSEGGSVDVDYGGGNGHGGGVVYDEYGGARV